nr:capsid protein [Tick-associated circular DNA virus]
MAYARKSRKPRRGYRKSGPKRRSGLRSRYTGKMRRSTRARPMSKKSILNTTSRKKRDTMLTVTNTAPGSGGPLPSLTSPVLVVSAEFGHVSCWNATARDLSLSSGPIGSVAQEAVRTSSTCYMRGLSENIRLGTSTDCAWFWRRICFTLRGSAFRTTANGDSPVTPYATFSENSNGIGRLWLNQNINTMGNTIAVQQGVLFRGAANVDWRDLITAPVDNTRVDLKYDKTRTIRSGNSRGVVREYKMWHPMNKNLVYADDEAGDVMIPNNFSVEDKRGMGDYYIVDIIIPANGGVRADTLTIDSTSTLYWHER